MACLVNSKVAQAFNERILRATKEIGKFAEEYNATVAASVRSKINALDMKLNLADNNTMEILIATMSVVKTDVFKSWPEEAKVILTVNFKTQNRNIWPTVVATLLASQEATIMRAQQTGGAPLQQLGGAPSRNEFTFIGRENVPVKLYQNADAGVNWQKINQEMHGLLRESAGEVFEVVKDCTPFLRAVEAFGGLQDSFGQEFSRTWDETWAGRLEFAKGLKPYDKFKKNGAGQFERIGVCLAYLLIDR
jgi:hypothetical protein